MVTIPVQAADEKDPSEITEQDLPEERFIQDYIMGPGDVLDISVWKNKDMSRTLTVLPDGKVAFPLIGEVIVAGKTVAQLKTELENRLSPRFILNPVLSVEIRQVNSMLIYIIGKVNHPGRFALNANINVLQALSMAGGLNVFAKRNEIKIFREEGRRTRIFEFRYDDVSYGENLEQNIRLRRGDVIVVP
ncbi:polysaccharide biosynthesis/export family protein [Desulfococcaceae bacterium HSG8]|nr:polysaccharide biosynthesis/export family protein [Desulfococcaceae bacterium HSG8]